MRFFSLSMRKPSHSFPLPQGNSPREDFLFDEEKTSWQLSRTAMSFSLRQRRNPHERKILLRVSGGRWWRAMSFSLRQRGNPHEEKILVGEGGYGGHKGEYLKIIFYWSLWGFLLHQKGNPHIPSPSLPPTRKFNLLWFPRWQREKLVATSEDSHEFFSSSKKKSS